MAKEINLNPCTVHTINLFADRILIKLLVPEKKSKEGLILPPGVTASSETVWGTEHPYQGIGIRVGSGLINGTQWDMEVKEGDIIYMESELDLNRERIKINGGEYGMIHKSKILGYFRFNN